MIASWYSLYLTASCWSLPDYQLLVSIWLLVSTWLSAAGLYLTISCWTLPDCQVLNSTGLPAAGLYLTASCWSLPDCQLLVSTWQPAAFLYLTVSCWSLRDCQLLVSTWLPAVGFCCEPRGCQLKLAILISANYQQAVLSCTMVRCGYSYLAARPGGPVRWPACHIWCRAAGHRPYNMEGKGNVVIFYRFHAVVGFIVPRNTFQYFYI